MRVLHVISGLGTGGAESFLAELAPRLAAQGFEQRVVSLTGDGPLAARLNARGIPVDLLDARGPLGPVAAARHLTRLVARHQPAILQGWMYHGDLLAALAHRLARGRSSRRLLWNIRCSDMRLEDYSRQLRAVVRACTWLSPLPDAVLANSTAGARMHQAAGYRPRALHIVPNGVDGVRFKPDPLARLAARQQLGLPLEAVVIMNVARVDPMKDHAGLLAAAEQLRGATLVLVGTGTEALARPPHVLGLGPRHDVPRLLAAADVIVSSSAYGEGFSNALAEGMAVGLVPVTTDVGDAREIVGETGEVVPPRDPRALAVALQQIVDLTSPARSARGEAARARILDRFTLDTAVARFASIYAGGRPAS